jgi:hypothetical protein
MTVKSNDPLKDIDDNRINILKTQYDKLTNDWRSFNNIIWGVPTVAIAIMTGILIGAYDRLADGTWERIASLGIGSIFLFALTIEVIKKRYHMNVISSLLKDLQVELGLEEKFRFPLGIDGDINKYLAHFTDGDKKTMFADYEYDPLFEFFRFSYARKYLTYVIFSAATILAILAEWEFIYHQKLGDWWTTAVTGILVGAAAVVIPVFWYKYKKQEEKKEPEKEKKEPEKEKKEPEKMRRLINIEPIKRKLLISSQFDVERLTQGDNQTITITATDANSKKQMVGIIIKGEIYPSDEIAKLDSDMKVELEEGITNWEGQCSYTWNIDKCWKPGKYEVKIISVTTGYKCQYELSSFEVIEDSYKC